MANATNMFEQRIIISYMFLCFILDKIAFMFFPHAGLRCAPWGRKETVP